MFTVMDFVIIPTWDCLQFLTVDDVLIPAVRNLGGDHNYVKLTAICEDAHVRQYFQRNGIWDFGDFEAYFHGHTETWDYKPENQSLRIRSKDDSVKPPPAKQAKISSGPPTKVVCLTNLVGAGDVDEDLQEETAGEAKKYGKLKSCVIKELKGVPDDEAVRIFLEFDAVDSATKCLKDMSGRFFGGRKVKAQYYDEKSFGSNDLSK